MRSRIGSAQRPAHYPSGSSTAADLMRAAQTIGGAVEGAAELLERIEALRKQVDATYWLTAELALAIEAAGKRVSKLAALVPGTNPKHGG